MSDRTDALESLLLHPGWRIILDLARLEWIEKERAGVKAIVSQNDPASIEKLRQVVAAREAVEWVLELPRQEIGRLKRQEMEPASPSLRGPGPMTAGMSRRGSL